MRAWLGSVTPAAGRGAVFAVGLVPVPENAMAAIITAEIAMIIIVGVAWQDSRGFPGRVPEDRTRPRLVVFDLGHKFLPPSPRNPWRSVTGEKADRGAHRGRKGEPPPLIPGA